MKLNSKDYKILKTKKHFKANNLFFFANGANQNSSDWLATEQGLKTLGFSYYKLFNKTTVKTLNNSIYNNIKSIVSGPTFFINPSTNKPLSKQTISNNLDLLLFELLMVKFNNKIYSIKSLKNTYSLDYKETKLVFYQFGLTHLKSCSKFSK